MGKSYIFFPFTEEGRNFVERKGLSINELVGFEEFGDLRERALKRVVDSINGEGSEETVNPLFLTEYERDLEILSYPLARVIVSCLRNKRLLKRFCFGESERFKCFVEELEEFDARELLEKMGYKVSGDFMDVASYLKLSKDLVEDKWRLINRVLTDGEVGINDVELVDLFGSAARQEIEKNLPIDVSPEICSNVSHLVGRVNELIEEPSFREEDLEFSESSLPPCIEMLIKQVEEGEELSHPARFALTSFLKEVGLEVEEILEIFKSSPDFEKERAEYQVRHIAGSGQPSGYVPPSCSTMKSYGNCPGEKGRCKAKTVTHPLTYYKWALEEDG